MRRGGRRRVLRRRGAGPAQPELAAERRPAATGAQDAADAAAVAAADEAAFAAAARDLPATGRQEAAVLVRRTHRHGHVVAQQQNDPVGHLRLDQGELPLLSQCRPQLAGAFFFVA